MQILTPPSPLKGRKRKSDDNSWQLECPPKRSTPKNYVFRSGKLFNSHRRSLDISQNYVKFYTKMNVAKLTQEIHKNYGSQQKYIKDSMNRRNEIRTLVFDKIRTLYNGVHVCIVGSSVNGLGFKSSGLDLLVMFEKSCDNRQLAVLKSIKSIVKREAFATHLKVRNGKTDVPHITFVDSVAKITVTIKVNQRRSVLSTKLINSYTRIDNRVGPLILVVKSWAHQIGTSADKLLNGYSLSLMAIHFLQSGCKPAVLPESHTIIKTESEDFDFRTQRLYETLPPFQSKNEESVGELLQNFLDYYGHKFAFTKNVISIRSTEPILKSKYLQSSDLCQKNPVYVEEPFDLTNTASSVDRDAATQTIHAFRRTLYTLTADHRYITQLF